MEKIDIKSLDYAELQNFFESLGEKSFRAKQVYQWIHEKLANGFDEMTNLPKSLRDRLSAICSYTCLVPAEVLTSRIDGTQKYLFRLADGNVVESVLMKYKHGNSVCISTQVGCRMGCRFCASTLGGLTRQLTVSEMLDEVYRIQKISGERVSNLVLMGTGEPLDNYENVVKFIRMLSDGQGLNISQRNITLSTCGIVPKMRELAGEGLARLHAAAAAGGWDTIVCPSPEDLGRIEHLLIPGLGLAFVTSRSGMDYGKKPHRRIRLDAMTETGGRTRLRFQARMAALLREEAVTALKDAKASHDRLEAVYNPYVDFDGVRELAAIETGRLLSYLDR